VLRADVAYASPEVVDFQPVDGRADLFSLGLVLLETLTGRYPPDVRLPPAESPEVRRYTAEVRVERPSWEPVGHLSERIRRFGPEDVERAARNVPEGLRPLLHKALRLHPDDRYQTGAEMRDALRDWLDSQGEPSGAEQVATELARLVREMPSPREVGAFPTEKGVILTPEEAALAEGAWRERKYRS
jgi:eukaryotic-like serine/threonine-protein kinase